MRGLISVVLGIVAGVGLVAVAGAAALPAGKLPGTFAFTGQKQPCNWANRRACADEQVFIARPDGTVKQISHGPIHARALSMSPDGSRVLVCRGGGKFCDDGTYVMRLDGSFEAEVPASGTMAWSPDGRRLLYADYGPLVVRIDGTGQRSLVDPASLPRRQYIKDGDGGACWSSDGRLVVFALVRGLRRSLYVVPTDKQVPVRARRIYRTRQSTDVYAFDSGPVCSPSAPTVAFGDRGFVFSVRLDGTHLRRLSAGSDPTWSPDGKQISFSSTSAPPGPAVMNADGTEVRSTPRICHPGQWSPNSTACAYGGIDGVIYTAALDGSGGARVASRRGWRFVNPFWQLRSRPQRP